MIESEWVKSCSPPPGTLAKDWEDHGGEAIQGRESGKMSVNNSQTLAVSGQDLSRNGSSRVPWEDARANLKPSSPSRKPKPVSKHCSALPVATPHRSRSIWKLSKIVFILNQTQSNKKEFKFEFMQIAKDFPQEPDILLLLCLSCCLDYFLPKLNMMSNSIFMDVLHIFVRSQLTRQVILWLTPLTLQFWPVPSGTVPACGVSLKKVCEDKVQWDSLKSLSQLETLRRTQGSCLASAL